MKQIRFFSQQLAGCRPFFLSYYPDYVYLLICCGICACDCIKSLSRNNRIQPKTTHTFFQRWHSNLPHIPGRAQIQHGRPTSSHSRSQREDLPFPHRQRRRYDRIPAGRPSHAACPHAQSLPRKTEGKGSEVRVLARTSRVLLGTGSNAKRYLGLSFKYDIGTFWSAIVS